MEAIDGQLNSTNCISQAQPRDLSLAWPGRSEVCRELQFLPDQSCGDSGILCQQDLQGEANQNCEVGQC